MIKEPDSLSSVRNAVRILRVFTQEEPELGITQISRRLGISKSSVARIIRTFCNENLLIQNKETQKYRLWLSAFEIGSIVYHDIEVCHVALPLLKKLAADVSGVIQMTMYDRGGIIYLLKLPEEKDTRIVNSMGKRIPAHCTASGKVLLAFQDQHEIESVAAEALKPFTSKTIVSPDLLLRELTKIRKDRYAVSREEFKPGIYSVAVPVNDDFGRILASISVSGPKNEFPEARIQYLNQVLKTYSRLITEQLGKTLFKKKRQVPY